MKEALAGITTDAQIDCCKELLKKKFTCKKQVFSGLSRAK
jgi:hypothetical protein